MVGENIFFEDFSNDSYRIEKVPKVLWLGFKVVFVVKLMVRMGMNKKGEEKQKQKTAITRLGKKKKKVIVCDKRKIINIR